MKRKTHYISFIVLLAMVLNGCHYKQNNITHDKGVNNSSGVLIEHSSIENDETSDYIFNNIDISKYTKEEVKKLNLMWNDFRSEMSPDKDPSQDFKNSVFLEELKVFLGNRQSLELSPNKFAELISQNDFFAVDKKYFLGGKEYNIRVIGYNADLYVQTLTDAPIKSKWIFVQCWNANAFYFTTLSDGDLYYLYDFMPFEANDKLNIVIMGKHMSYGQYPSF